MRIKWIVIGLILIAISCNTQKQDNSSTVDTNGENESESSVVYDPSAALWKYDFNQQTGNFDIIQLRPVDPDTLTGEAIEKIINNSWPRIRIQFNGTSNDTAFVSIPVSTVLTQQMGSSGAESYMISTTYSFTELKGINNVFFDFEEGDHGIPGVYNRNSWHLN
jgi:hypothetical protein